MVHQKVIFEAVKKMLNQPEDKYFNLELCGPIMKVSDALKAYRGN